MKQTLTDEQWEALRPAIQDIDGGCSSCIWSFFQNLKHTVVIERSILEKIKIYGNPMDEKFIKDILEGQASEVAK